MRITNKEKPTDVLITSDRKQAVKLRIGKGEKDGIEALSVPANFARTAEKYGDVVAMKYKKGTPEWQSVTYRSVRANVESLFPNKIFHFLNFISVNIARNHFTSLKRLLN